MRHACGALQAVQPAAQPIIGEDAVPWIVWKNGACAETWLSIQPLKEERVTARRAHRLTAHGDQARLTPPSASHDKEFRLFERNITNSQGGRMPLGSGICTWIEGEQERARAPKTLSLCRAPPPAPTF